MGPQDGYVAARESRRPSPPAPPVPDKGKYAVKVIASSIRKGNIIDVEGKLYVILTAENIHPGKGTPVTQVDMRRLSDGVKSSQRYKTTDMLERAVVEDREFQYLYEDADGFHFMNMESYDQVSLPPDLVADGKYYLQPEMKVKLSIHEGTAVGIELPQRAVGSFALAVDDERVRHVSRAASGGLRPPSALR